MFEKANFDFDKAANSIGIFACSQCNYPLFRASNKFEAGCAFPSFWKHISDHVKLNPLNTYGRERTQLLCNNCGQHLGHLFSNKLTPTKVRYCINENALVFKTDTA